MLVFVPIVVLVLLIVLGAFIAFFRHKISTLEGTDSLWWHYDPNTPGIVALASCLWNLIVLQHTSALLVRSVQRSDAPVPRLQEFVGVIEADIGDIARRLTVAVFLPQLRHTAVEHFLHLQEYVGTFAAEIREN
jgi:hypothetical protein